MHWLTKAGGEEWREEKPRGGVARRHGGMEEEVAEPTKVWGGETQKEKRGRRRKRRIQGRA